MFGLVTQQDSGLDSGRGPNRQPHTEKKYQLANMSLPELLPPSLRFASMVVPLFFTAHPLNRRPGRPKGAQPSPLLPPTSLIHSLISADEFFFFFMLPEKRTMDGVERQQSHKRHYKTDKTAKKLT